MSRQLDVQQEVRETARRNELVKALEFGIAGSIEAQGMQLLGLSISIQPFDCTCVVKAQAEERRVVAFVNADTMMNVLIKVFTMANNYALKWGADKYYSSDA